MFKAAMKPLTPKAAAKWLKKFQRHVDRLRSDSEAYLAEFTQALMTSPRAFGCRQADRAIRAAAALDVIRRVENDYSVANSHLKRSDPDHDYKLLLELREVIGDAMLTGARFPPTYTSPTANLFTIAETEAFADIYAALVVK